MDQNVWESPTGDVQLYEKNHELDHPMRQAYQEDFDDHDAGALARTFPYYYAPNPFDGFRDFQDLENRQDFEQFDAQDPGHYHGQYRAEDQYQYEVQEHVEEEAEEDVLYDIQDEGQYNAEEYIEEDVQEHDQYYDQEDGQEDGQEGGEYEDDDQDDSEDESQAATGVVARALYQKGVEKLMQGGLYKGLIKSEEEYYSRFRVQDEVMEIKRAGAPIDIPELDDVQKQFWAGKLFLAFKNTDDIQDKPAKNGKLAQAAMRLKSNYYPDEAIEEACWKVVVDCELAARGVQLVDPHHNTRSEQYNSFDERMLAVIDVCKYSKAACKQILDPPYHHRLIDAPDNEFFVKESNQVLNTKRDFTNNIGRKSMRKQGITVDDVMKNKDLRSKLLEAAAGGDNLGEESEGLEEVGDGSEIDDYTTPKRTPTKKTLSGSAKAPSMTSKRGSGGMGLPGFTQTPAKADASVQDEASPLSLKRKRRSVSAKNYKLDDNPSTEDSGVSEYDDDVAQGKHRSAKKAATDSSRVRAETPTPSLASSDFRKPSSSKPRSGSTVARKGKKDNSKFSPYREAKLFGVPGSGSPYPAYAPFDPSNDHIHGYDGSYISPVPMAHPPGYAEPKLPFPIPGGTAEYKDHGKFDYKLIITEILGIPRQMAGRFTLDQYREYARAVNLQFVNEYWEITGYDGQKYTCKNLQLYDHNKKAIIPHFAQYKYHLAWLASLRHEINEDGKFNPRGLGTFSTDGDVQKDMALGVIDNPYGLHPQKHPQLGELKDLPF